MMAVLRLRGSSLRGSEGVFPSLRNNPAGDGMSGPEPSTLTFLTFGYKKRTQDAFLFLLHIGMERTTRHVGKTTWHLLFPDIGTVLPGSRPYSTKKGRLMSPFVLL